MKRIRSAAAILILILVGLQAGSLAQPPAAARSVGSAGVKAEKFFRTELYLGCSKPDGTLVSDADWRLFLAEIVTPRFPEGFTVIPAYGQYREKSGRVISESSHVLIFLYPANNKRLSRAKVEEVRAAYIKRFGQESVLRVDLPKTVRVSF